MPPNHYTASLSPLDLAIVAAVPPGGNWKDVPSSIPSKRLATIRASYARGEGSRSTYYGRLRPDAPSYTINTYLSRPGNGCHIHYAQDRVLSQREAARLQSFPDSFAFRGTSKSAINKQIGNAVAPLLAYRLACGLGEPGVFVDLFAGAGGLSLGFRWAGWTPLVANDADAQSLATYAANIHDTVVLGDIRRPEVRETFLATARQRRAQAPDRRFLVLGGPPCQGFSTAGKRRSMDDERNQLFREYRLIVDALAPDGFVFENVPGLLNMQQGRVFADVCAALAGSMRDIRADVLKTEHHGIPQRRARVFVLASRDGTCPSPPPPLTDFPLEAAERRGLPVTPGVREAIGDLAPLAPRQEGSDMPLRAATSDFQRLCRGELDPAGYVATLSRRSSPCCAPQPSS